MQQPLDSSLRRSVMFIVCDPTHGARFFGEFVAINIPLLRSEDDVKYRVGFVVLFGALQ
jgi:hypothetical protein